MAVYGSDEGIKQLLRAVVSSTFSSDESARVTALRTIASVLVEAETGAVFATGPTAVARVVEDVPVGTTLYLPVGLRSVTSIVANPETWDGTTWTGGTLLTSVDYRLAGRNQDGVYRTILAVDTTWGSWGGRYVITGIWEDQVSSVPAEIDYVTNYIAAELFKVQNASPAGFTGPDGAVVPIRNVLKAPEVVKVFALHRVGVGVWF